MKKFNSPLIYVVMTMIICYPRLSAFAQTELPNVPVSETASFNDITFGNGVFVAAGEGGSIRISKDGLAWKDAKSGVRQTLYGVAWCGDCFISVGDRGIILLSADGNTWCKRNSGIKSTLRGVGSIGNHYIAVGDKGTILVSENGKKWIKAISGTDTALYSVAAHEQLIVTVGDDSTILTSTDGISWNNVKSNTDKNASYFTLKKVKWQENKFIAVGYLNGNTVYPAALESPTGEVWVERIVQQTVNNQDVKNIRLYGVAWDGTQDVAVGNSGSILTLPSCSKCSKLLTVAETDLNGIASDGNRLIAVGTGGKSLVTLEQLQGILPPKPFSITSEAVKDKTRTGAFLIDVRTDTEYQTEHIPGSIFIPLNQLQLMIESIVPDKQKEIIVYCQTGVRSARAVEILIKLGYTDVYDLGGIDQWPFEKVSGQ